jgi:uncharacterized membrane protein
MERRDIVPALALGIGLAGTLDEVVLHQLLHWHHFYDKSTPAWGLISDGLFHAASTALLVWGTYALVRGRARVAAREALGWILVGLGAFNLYDGTIQHKVLRLHQVRPGASPQWAYDLGFLSVATVITVSGVLLTLAARRRARPSPSRGDD